MDLRRLTTDNPVGNLETMLNNVYAKDGNAVIRFTDTEDGRENVDICEYFAELIKDYCEECTNAEGIKDGDCLECQACRCAILYAACVQAAELRERLMMYEDKAEQGLLIDLQCKAGDKIYAISETRIKPATITETHILENKKIEYLVDFDCDLCCEDCPFADWSQLAYSGEWTCNGEYGEDIINGTDLGKTVFFTYEEAELALKAQTPESEGNCNKTP